MLGDGFHDVPLGKVAMVVTYLEMHAPVPTQPVELASDVSFRAVKADPVWFRDILTRVGSTEWLWYGRLKHSETDLLKILQDPLVEHYTLAKDGRDEALLELDFREDKACEISFFGLTQPLIGTGSGRYLMNEAITRAWARSIDRLHVHTCTLDSPQALSFYRRSGFTPVRQAVEIDDDPRLTGLLPSSYGPNVPIFKP